MTLQLPPPVLALTDAARRVLGSAPRHPAPPNVPRGVLLEYAQRHGMLTWAPGLVANEAALAHMTRALDGVRQLLDLVAMFEASDIAVVALKGPAFSQWVYGDPAARRFSDLDLLVSTTDRHRARALLERVRFSRRIPAAAGDVVYAGLGAWPMVHPDRMDVDLHWKLAGRRFSRAVPADAVLREAVTVPLARRMVRVPRPAHAAILTLTHAAKHLWYALELPFSIAALARRTDIDWNEVRTFAVRAGALRGAAAGLALASELFAVAIPPSFREDVRLEDVRVLCRHAFTTLALPPGIFAPPGLERRIHRLAFDRSLDRLLYDVRRTFEPTRAEYEWISLPSALAPLYWPARLVRLAIRWTRDGRSITHAGSPPTLT